MKKLILIFSLVLMTIGINAQGIFQPVENAFGAKQKAISKDEALPSGLWLWRFDATVAFQEYTWIKAEKQFVVNDFSAICLSKTAALTPKLLTGSPFGFWT